MNIGDSAPVWTASTAYSVGDLVQKSVSFIDGGNTNRTRTVIYKCKTANSDAEFTAAKWEESGNYLEIVGNGTDNTRSNARTLDWDGNERLMGDVYVGCNADSTGGSKLAKVSELPDISGKADKTDTVLNTTLSRGRKGLTTVADGSFAFGNGVEASGLYSHAEGSSSKARNVNAHAEGDNTTASGLTSHAEGGSTTASGTKSHAEGDTTTASGQTAHAEGTSTTASASYSHAEGYNTIASGSSAHAEGSFNTASEIQAHAEGFYTTASGKRSHTEGEYTKANGRATHASGTHNPDMTAIANWVANTEYAVGDYVKNSYDCYRCKETNNDAEFDSEKWDQVPWDTIQAFVVGNGIDSNNKSNALTLDWTGDLHLAKDIYVNANANGTGGNRLATETYVNTQLAASLPAPQYVEYTIRIDENNSDSTSAIIYLDDAASMSKGSSSWDTKPIFNNIKPCVF